ncbi:MAG: glycosyltransferase family 2 protein [Planctomycetota bacterium]|jgi:hypothetical protein
MTAARWQNRPAWIAEHLKELRRERDRIGNTVRYQLGSAVLAWRRRPWRVFSLLQTVVMLIRRGPARQSPLFHPPVPATQIPEAGAEGEEASPEARQEVLELASEISAIERGLPFYLGRELLALRWAPWRVVRLPGKLRRFAPLGRPPPCEPDSSKQVPILEHGPPLPAAPGRRLRWSCLAPPWLEEMLAHEGVRPDGDSGVDTAPEALLIGLAEAAPGHLEQRLAAARRAGTRTACWLLGAGPHPDLVSPLRLADAVFAADPDVALWARDLLGRPAHALPPAVQPRLQNPIGRWPGSLAHPVPWTPEPPPADDWQRLQRLAHGQLLGDEELARMEAVLGAPLPRPEVPPWAGRSSDLWLRMAQTRRVLKSETVARRLQRVGETLGLPGAASSPRVSVMLCTYRPAFLEEALSHYAAQTYDPRELLLVLNGDGFDPRRVERLVATIPAPVRVYRTPASWPKARCLQLACECARGELFVNMDDDDWYGPRYVEDLVLALLFSEAGIVCKTSHLTRFDADGRMILVYPGFEFRYGEWGGGAAMGLRREVLQEVRWRDAPTGEDALFFSDCRARGIPILSTARFQFVCRRRHPKHHTWKMPRADLYRIQLARELPAGARPEDFLP